MSVQIFVLLWLFFLDIDEEIQLGKKKKPHMKWIHLKSSQDK